MLSAFAVVVLLALWELGSRVGQVPTLFFPSPTTILRTLVRMVGNGTIPRDLAATLLRVSEGAVLGCVPACLLGLAMGWSVRLRAVLDPLVAAVHPMPKIAVLPLLMVIFGIGEVSKVVAVGLAAFFPMLLSTVAGVRHISPQLFEVARVYGAGRRKTFLRIVLPGALPMMLTGVRLAVNLALLITVAVELVSARTGLGRLIWFAWETLRTEELYAGLTIIAAVGVGFNALLARLTSSLVPWATEPEQ